MSDAASIVPPEVEAPAAGHTHNLLPKSPRWTHIALPATNIDASIAWYETYTPLCLLDRREDADGSRSSPKFGPVGRREGG